MRRAQGRRSPILELPKFPKPVRRPKATKAEAEAMDEKGGPHCRGDEVDLVSSRLGSLIRKIIDTQAYEALGFRTMHSSEGQCKIGGERVQPLSRRSVSVRALEGGYKRKS